MMLEPTGLKRPYKLVTMQEIWFAVAAEFGLPRYLFSDKLALMKFVLGGHIIGMVIKDGQEESWSMSASLEAMNAVMLNLHQTGVVE